MNKLLIVFSYKFPYEPPTEQFLYKELPYHMSTSTAIWIVPYAHDIDCNKKYNYDTGSQRPVVIKRLNRDFKRVEMLKGVAHLIKHIPSFVRDCIKIIFGNGTWRKAAFKLTIVSYIQSGVMVQQMKKQLNTADIAKYEQVTLYSYWLNPMACAVVHYKRYLHRHGVKQVSVISRAHGQNDLYLPIKTEAFRPEQRLLSKGLDRIYSISGDGISHLQKQGIKNVKLARLGVDGVDVMPLKKPNRIFTIVSCSIINENKQISSIAEAVAAIQSEVCWIHFGGGALENELRSWCEKNMPANVSWKINGWTPNSEIMRYYIDNTPDLFINLSRIEGIPVSIMEAMSYGIPCIATNVGANGEIVHSGENGFLLDLDFSIGEVTDRIMEFIGAKHKEMRYDAFRTAKEHFCAENNFSFFAKTIWEIGSQS